MLKNHWQTKTRQRYHPQPQPTPHQVLKRYFGFDNFRPNQLEIIKAILDNRDTLAVMPTGSGKSLCFQVPALIFPGTTLVISPLIALMKDQVQHLLAKGISAGLLTSALTKTQQHEQLELFRLRKLKLFYVAPERLRSKKFLKACLRADINLLVVDEAHCISQWGHDFRPDYRLIYQLIEHLVKNNLKRPTIAAFTATATEKTQVDITNNLNLLKPKKFILPMIRVNLSISVINLNSLFDKNMILLRLVKKHKQENGLIYVYSRQSALDVVNLIQQFFPKLNTAYYHAGLTKETRADIEMRFINHQINLLVATNAFGMGIDKPDIRFVIHYQPPPSIENYYQEIGRAGRDGKLSQTYLLNYPEDWLIHKTFMRQDKTRQKNLSMKLANLKAMFELARQNKTCRTQLISAYFGQPIKSQCHKCDVCGQKQTLNDFKLVDELEKQRYQQLLNKRQQLSKQLKISPTTLATNKELEQIAFFQPRTKDDLLKLAGVGKGNVNLILNFRF